MLYTIKQHGISIGTTESLIHCRKQENGTVILDPNGSGIVFKDVIYNVDGYDSVTVEESSTEEQIQSINDSILDVMDGIADLYAGGTN